jgi:hypothetical protein
MNKETRISDGDDHVRLDTGLGKNAASAFDDASAKNIAALD